MQMVQTLWPMMSKRFRDCNPLTSSLSLPGWDESYTKDELRALLKRYEEIGEEQL